MLNHLTLSIYPTKKNIATSFSDSHFISNGFLRKHGFQTISCSPFITSITVFAQEKTQVLHLLAISVKRPQLDGFLLIENRSHFLKLKALLPGKMNS